MAISIGALCDAVATTLSTTAGLATTQSYDQLTEGMNTLPCLQVYPERWEVSADSGTDRLTFVKQSTGVPGVRQTELTLHLDLYVRQRSQLDEDWGAAVDLASVMQDKLDEEGPCPHFGDGTYIRSFRYSVQRVIFAYAQTSYLGFRFTLTMRVF
jgi:hypothetical protein